MHAQRIGELDAYSLKSGESRVECGAILTSNARG